MSNSVSVAGDSPIVLIDDEQGVLKGLENILFADGLENTLSFRDPLQALRALPSLSPSLIVLDLIMPGMAGEEVLGELREISPETPVIVLTGKNDIEAAVSCMRGGAFDYLVKAVDPDRFLSSVRRALEFRQLRREISSLRESILDRTLRSPQAFSEIVSASDAMAAVFRLVDAIAPSLEPVLVTGETGVGKELIAAAIHRASGRPGEALFVNVAGLDDTMFSDALFGHARGAYTGASTRRGGMVEQAGSGTLILDEIGDLSIASQIKLLRLLDSGEYYPLGGDDPRRCRARIVALTNRELPVLIQEQAFRRDLYFRLSTHEVRVPPLRARPEDIRVLAKHFYSTACEALERRRHQIPERILELLEGYSFPGNVRELRSLMYDAASRQGSRSFPSDIIVNTLQSRGFEVPEQKPEEESAGRSGLAFGPRLPSIKECVELLIEEALRRTNGTQSSAAALLGVTPQALNNRLRRSQKRQ